MNSYLVIGFNLLSLLLMLMLNFFQILPVEPLQADFCCSVHFIWRRKWQPTPMFLPGESQGWGSLVGCRLWGRTESDTTEAT